jgi:AcrR family transcriptional regulator
MTQTAFRTRKSEQTFETVLRTATELFRQQGFHRTTMRDLSRESGLGLGALYYYFRSKEELVLRFYERTNEQVVGEFRSREEDLTRLPEALARFLRLKLEHLEPYRPLLTVVMKEAIDPDSPLSPMSRESAKTLDLSLGLFLDLVEASNTARGEEARQMARGLWLAHMLLLLYWLHDRSEGFQATHRAIDTLAALVRWTNTAGRIPGFKRLRSQVLARVSALFGEAPETEEE